MYSSQYGQPQQKQFGKQSSKQASFAMLPPASLIPKARGSYKGQGLGFSPVPAQKQPDRWMESDPAQQAQLAQAGMDEITRVAGQQAAYEPNVQPGPSWQPKFDPRVMMQQAPMEVQNFPMPKDLASAPRSLMNSQGALEQARGAFSPMLSNMQYGAERRREFLDSSIDMAKKSMLSNSLKGPLSSIIGAFMPQGANQVMQNFGAQGNADNAAMFSGIMNQMQAMDQSGMQQAQFLDNHMRYWDPNSPTNHNQDLQNKLAFMNARNQQLQGMQQGYRDTTARQQMLGQLDLNQAKQMLDQDQFVNQVQQQGVQNRRNDLLDNRAYEHQMFGDEMAAYNAQMGYNQEGYNRERQGKLDTNELIMKNATNRLAYQKMQQEQRQQMVANRLKNAELLVNGAKGNDAAVSAEQLRAGLERYGVLPPTPESQQPTNSAPANFGSQVMYSMMPPEFRTAMDIAGLGSSILQRPSTPKAPQEMDDYNPSFYPGPGFNSKAVAKELIDQAKATGLTKEQARRWIGQQMGEW